MGITKLFVKNAESDKVSELEVSTFEEYSDELVELYGPVPEDLKEVVLTHEVDTAIEGSIDVDKDVVFDEISE